MRWGVGVSRRSSSSLQAEGRWQVRGTGRSSRAQGIGRADIDSSEVRQRPIARRPSSASPCGDCPNSSPPLPFPSSAAVLDARVAVWQCHRGRPFSPRSPIQMASSLPPSSLPPPLPPPPTPSLLRVPGHFNSAQLLRWLFDSSDCSPSRGEEEGDVKGGEDRAEEERSVGREGVTGEAADSLSSPPPLYPLTRELALIVVRDLHRLCQQRADHVRRRCLREPALAPLTPPHPTPLTQSTDERLLSSLLHRLLRRLTGLSASAAQLKALRAQSPLIGRASAVLDSASKRRFLSEPYDLSSNENAQVASSPSVLSSLASFSARQSRSWFRDRRDPLSHLTFTQPLAQLQGVGRLPCPQCKRQSVPPPLSTSSDSDLSGPSAPSSSTSPFRLCCAALCRVAVLLCW